MYTHQKILTPTNRSDHVLAHSAPAHIDRLPAVPEQAAIPLISSTEQETIKFNAPSPFQLPQKSVDSKQVLVISSKVQGWKQLQAAVNDNTLVIPYDADRTTLSMLYKRIEHSLAGTPTPHLGFMMHGENGSSQLLSNLQLDLKTFNRRSDLRSFWRDLGQLVAQEGSIDLAACQLAQSVEGRQLIAQLKETTGVEIGASAQILGNNAYSSNWLMETSAQDLSLRYFKQQQLMQWTGTLATVVPLSINNGCYQYYNGIATANLVNTLYQLMSYCKTSQTFRDSNNTLISDRSDFRFMVIVQMSLNIAPLYDNLYTWSMLSAADAQTQLGVQSSDWIGIKTGLQNIVSLLSTNFQLFDNTSYAAQGLASITNSTVFMTAAENFFKRGAGINPYSRLVTQLLQYIQEELDCFTDLGLIKQIGYASPLQALRQFVYASFANIDRTMGQLGQEIGRRNVIMEVLNPLEALFTQNWQCDPYNSLVGNLNQNSTVTTSGAVSNYSLLGRAFYSTSNSNLATVSNPTANAIHYGLLFGADAGIVYTDSFWTLHAQTTPYLKYTIPSGFTSAPVDMLNTDFSSTQLNDLKQYAFGTTTHPLWGNFPSSGTVTANHLFQLELQRFNSARSDINLSNLNVGNILWIPVRKGVNSVYAAALQASPMQQALDRLIALRNNGILQNAQDIATIETVIANLTQALLPTSTTLSSTLLNTFKNTNYKLYSGAMADQPYPPSIGNSNLILDGTLPDFDATNHVNTPPKLQYSTNGKGAAAWYQQLYNATCFWEGSTWNGINWENNQQNSSFNLAEGIMTTAGGFSSNALQQMTIAISRFQEILQMNKNIMQKYLASVKSIDKALCS